MVALTLNFQIIYSISQQWLAIAICSTDIIMMHMCKHSAAGPGKEHGV